MRILFDGQVFLGQRVGGISRYFASLCQALGAIDGVDARVLAPFYINTYLTKLPRQQVIGKYVSSSMHPIRLITKKTVPGLSQLAGRLISTDVVHETYFTNNPFITRAKNRVTTVYDMIHELPEFGLSNPRASYQKRSSLARCDHVICISQNTKNDLCRLFNFPSEKISVVYLASQDFGAISMVEQTRMAPTTLFDLEAAPYFLHVGGRGGYKNFKSTLQAFASSQVLVRDFRIVCFGGGELTADERATAHNLGLAPKHLVQFGGADEALALAYSKAVALVYPSHYEGFGLPPLEAMSAGCPVVTSDAASMPEVIGDAGLMFPPSQIDALRHAMERVAHSEQLREDLSLRGRQHWTQFSWEACARATLQSFLGPEQAPMR